MWEHGPSVTRSSGCLRDIENLDFYEKFQLFNNSKHILKKIKCGNQTNLCAGYGLWVASL